MPPDPKDLCLSGKTGSERQAIKAALLTRTSSLRHPGEAHTLIGALAAGEVDRMVAQGDRADAADGEVWIERKSCLHRGARLVQPTESRQSSGEIEMRDGIISICFQPPVQPRDRFGVGVQLHLGEAHPHHPTGGGRIARRKTECLLDVGFGFRGAAEKNFGETDESMSVG